MDVKKTELKNHGNKKVCVHINNKWENEWRTLIELPGI